MPKRWKNRPEASNWVNSGKAGDVVPEKVSYNGYRIVDAEGRGMHGALGALSVSVAQMAETGVQGRAGFGVRAAHPTSCANPTQGASRTRRS